MQSRKVYDVIVLGLGGMGASAACHLARRGLKVLGLERHHACHDRGSSHGHSRIIRQSYFADPAYVPLLLRAYELWEQLERDTGQKLLHLCGGLMVGGERSEVVRGSLASARRHGLPHELLTAKEIRHRFPALHPGPEDVALYEERAGWVHPEATVGAHLELAAGYGADLHFHEPVSAWTASSQGEGVTVSTGNGHYRARHLVLAPGAWAPELMGDLGLPLSVERQVLFWFEPEGPSAHFEPGRLPVYIWECEDGVQFYGFPAQQGVPGVKVAFFRMEQLGLGQTCTPESINREVSAEEVAAMRRYLQSRVPGLNGQFLEARTCLYTNTPDMHFVLAQHPQYRQVSVACGFSGHGYKFASVVGEILADLAQSGHTGHPVGFLHPGRLLHPGA